MNLSELEYQVIMNNLCVVMEVHEDMLDDKHLEEGERRNLQKLIAFEKSFYDALYTQYGHRYDLLGCYDIFAGHEENPKFVF